MSQQLLWTVSNKIPRYIPRQKITFYDFFDF